MGGAIATRIIKANWPVVLWARRPEVLETFSADNVETAATPAVLAADADLIGICVWSDDDVRQVVAGEQGVLTGARPGTIVAIHSTILPSTSKALAEPAATNGVCAREPAAPGGRAVRPAGVQ